MFASLKKLMARKAVARRTRARTNRYIPQLEGLEDRRLMAVNFSVTGVRLDVISDNAPGPGRGAPLRNETVVITDNGTSGAGNIALKIGNAQAIPLNGIRDIFIDLKDGKDKVTYSMTGDLQGGVQRTVDVRLGGGVDTFSMGLIRDLLSGARFDLDVHGEADKDTLQMQVLPNFSMQNGVPVPDAWAIATDAVFDVSLNGGTKADTIRFLHTAPARAQVNGQLKLAMDGGDDADTLVATVGANVASGAVLDTRLSGGLGTDIIDFTYGGEMDGRLPLDLNGGATADKRLKAIVTLNPGSTGKVGDLLSNTRARVRGGDGNERAMEFRVRNNGSAEIFAALDGETGSNLGKRTANVEAFNITSAVVT